MRETRKIALCGNVNTEEVFARHLVSEGVTVDGYLLHPNDAFAKVCRNSIVLSRQDNLEEYLQTTLPALLQREQYDAILLGPDFMSRLLSDTLRQHDIPHIGATPAQLAFEEDKSLINEVFPAHTGILPARNTITSDEDREIEHLLSRFQFGYVLKFVGDYGSKFLGSPVGRVRLSGETITDQSEVLDFIRKSLEASGKCLVEEKLVGREFSANYAVDANSNLFRLGENICFKRRQAGNTGPICDGTGSISIGNTLPFLTPEDILFVEEQIVRPFHREVSQKTGIPLCALLNIDLMKTTDGRVVLLEINTREPGGHTAANIMAGLQTSFFDILRHMQAGTLDQLTPTFHKEVSLVVSAFPPYFPFGTTGELLEITVTKDIPRDVRLYTGWVDTVAETGSCQTLRLQNSPSLLFEHTSPNVTSARQRLYEVMAAVAPEGLDYRQDIGLELE